MPVFASVTAGSVNPAAIYVVRTIYIPTNNDGPIQYHPRTSPPLSFIHLYSPQTLVPSVTAHYIPPPYMSFVQFTPPPTTMCLYNIFTKPQTQKSTTPIIVCLQNFHTRSPYWRRYTFLSHLTTKSKISVRWINLCVGM